MNIKSLLKRSGEDDEDPSGAPVPAPSPYTPPPPVTADPGRPPVPAQPRPLPDISIGGSGAPSLSDVTASSAQAPAPEREFGDPTQVPQTPTGAVKAQPGFMTPEERDSEYQRTLSSRYGALNQITPWYLRLHSQDTNRAQAAKQAADELSAKSEALKYGAGLGERKLANARDIADQANDTRRAGQNLRHEDVAQELLLKAEDLRQKGDERGAQQLKLMAETYYMPEKMRQGAEGAAARTTRSETSASNAPSQQNLNNALAGAARTGQLEHVGGALNRGDIRAGDVNTAEALGRIPGIGGALSGAWQVAGGAPPTAAVAGRELFNDAQPGAAPVPPPQPIVPPRGRQAGPAAIPLPPELDARLRAGMARAGASPMRPVDQLPPPAPGEPAIPRRTATPPEKAPVVSINSGNDAEAAALIKRAGHDLSIAQVGQFRAEARAAAQAYQANPASPEASPYRKWKKYVGGEP